MSPDVAAARSSLAWDEAASVMDQKGTLAAISPPTPHVLGAAAAGELLSATRAGTGEVLGVLEGSPLLVVELGRGDEVATAVPTWLPCVVAAVADDPTGPAPAGADLAVCRAKGVVPPGWVAVDDTGSTLHELSTRIDASPQPAVVLAQLLRMSLALDVDAALMAESLAYSTLQAGPAFAAWLGSRRATGRKARHDGEPPVLVRRDGDTLTVTLNRPAVRNAVNGTLRDALAEALAVAAADPSIAGVALRGAGVAFSSGGDLDEFGTAPEPVTAHLARTGRSPARLLAGLGPLVTAHLHGPCIGAGIELAAFAGRVVAAPDTTLCLPEVALGLLPGSGGTVSIPRRTGRHRAAWLGISGTTIDASTARDWGLVDAVDPAR